MQIEHNVLAVAAPIPPPQFLLNEVSYEQLEVIDRNEACSLGVISLPTLDECVESIVFYASHFFLLRGREAFQDNSYEHIQKYDAHYKHEGDEIRLSHVVTTPLDAVFRPVMEVLMTLTLE